MNVFQTIAAVKKDLGAVAKGKTMTAGGTYKYRSIDDVLNALHGPMSEHGLVIAPRLRSFTQEHGVGNNGKQSRSVAEFEWVIAGPEGDSFIAATVGEAMDNQDKGGNKAGTAAFKMVLTQVLAIPFDMDDPDHYSPAHEATPAAKSADRKPQAKAPEKAAETDKAGGANTSPATSTERKCATCTYAIGPKDPVKKSAGAFHHAACLTKPKAEAAGAVTEDDISSIINAFPGATEE